MSYFGCPIRALQRVLFPEPFGPMMICISPALIVSEKSFRISLPSTATVKFLISSVTFLWKTFGKPCAWGDWTIFLCAVWFKRLVSMLDEVNDLKLFGWKYWWSPGSQCSDRVSSYSAADAHRLSVFHSPGNASRSPALPKLQQYLSA